MLVLPAAGAAGQSTDGFGSSSGALRFVRRRRGGGRVFLLLSEPQIGPQQSYVTSLSDSAVSHWSVQMLVAEVKSIQLRRAAGFQAAPLNGSAAAGGAPVNRADGDTNRHDEKSTRRPRGARQQPTATAGRHFVFVVLMRGGAV